MFTYDDQVDPDRHSSGDDYSEAGFDRETPAVVDGAAGDSDGYSSDGFEQDAAAHSVHAASRTSLSANQFGGRDGGDNVGEAADDSGDDSDDGDDGDGSDDSNEAFDAHAVRDLVGEFARGVAAGAHRQGDDADDSDDDDDDDDRNDDLDHDAHVDDSDAVAAAPAAAGGRLSASPPTPSVTSPHTLRVTVKSAVDLVPVHMKAMATYVRLSLVGSRNGVVSEATTGTVSGLRPSWSPTTGGSQVLPHPDPAAAASARPERFTLHVEAWDRSAVGQDTLLGAADVDVSAMVGTTAASDVSVGIARDGAESGAHGTVLLALSSGDMAGSLHMRRQGPQSSPAAQALPVASPIAVPASSESTVSSWSLRGGGGSLAPMAADAPPPEPDISSRAASALSASSSRNLSNYGRSQSGRSLPTYGRSQSGRSLAHLSNIGRSLSGLSASGFSVSHEYSPPLRPRRPPSVAAPLPVSVAELDGQDTASEASNVSSLGLSGDSM